MHGASLGDREQKRQEINDEECEADVERREIGKHAYFPRSNGQGEKHSSRENWKDDEEKGDERKPGDPKMTISKRGNGAFDRERSGVVE